MLVLPISIVVSLALGFLLLRSLLAGRRFWPIPALLAACAAQGVIISLYHVVPAIRLVQPVTATAIPPLAWLAFRTLMSSPFSSRRDWPHLGVPAFAAFCVAFAPQTLDIVVPGVFIAYGLAMLHALKSGADGLPLARLEEGEWPPLIWRAVAGTLLLSALGDIAIAAAQMAGQAWLQFWIVSIVSSATLLLIGSLSLSGSLDEGDEEAVAIEKLPSPVDAGRDTDIMGRLDAVLREQALFLDPNLSLSRLARRLGLPAKQLSASINRVTGENVSRHVNAYRIRHACARLQEGGSVTDAMLESGFNTKSNFNREFLRVTGLSPTAWLARHEPALPDAIPLRANIGLPISRQERYSGQA